MAEGEEEIQQKQQSIYRALRSIRKRESSLLYNALRSIHEDSTFVAEIAQLWPELPLVANLRCGLWYSPRFHSTCYFKSTDGHPNNCSFSTSRLNLHLPLLAGQRGGCIIVDSTRKGKRFPDSMTRTIPIWACVLNRAIAKGLRALPRNKLEQDGNLEPSNPVAANGNAEEGRGGSVNWDGSLHLPLWVSKTERASIEGRIDEWTKQLEDNTGVDIDSLVSSLKKPLRPLWISQGTVIWLNEVPGIDAWGFTPVILVSASSSSSSSSSQGVIRHSSVSEFSWHYTPGAGDDEESWARGLTPELFWRNAYEIIGWGPDSCNRKVAELVEKDRVYRVQRGENAPQKQRQSGDARYGDANSRVLEIGIPVESSNTERCSFFWIGSTDIAVSSSRSYAETVSTTAVDHCLVNCDVQNMYLHPSSSSSSYLHLPTQTSKVERFSLLNNLPLALDFATPQLSSGKKLVVCCCNGEDISVCVTLGILASLFDEEGNFDGGMHFIKSSISKWDIRKRLTFICRYAVSARPSRGNLRQVFNFLCRRKESVVSASSIEFAS